MNHSFRAALASALALALVGGIGTAAHAQTAPVPAKRPLAIDDVLGLEQIDRATLSPDGEWVAAVILRPALAGEAYGRASYDLDPTRGDVWLISTRTGERRPLTQGHASAAGYWCATWSPDGRRLAMLSTAPEGAEPHGGDNVRLYVWEKDKDRLRRMSDAPIMTQSRFGSAINALDLRGGADGTTAAHACTEGVVGENAPFLWLDDRRLLAVTLPAGERSVAVDQYARRYRAVAADAARLATGAEPTVNVVGSGAARTRGEAAAIVATIDAASGAATPVATVPAYPFRSGLTLSVAPDGRRLAILATAAALPPGPEGPFPNARTYAWTVERRLGFADLAATPALRWATLPDAARLPLELYDWSPDSRAVAFRARAAATATQTPLFVAAARDAAITPVAAVSVGGEQADADRRRAPAVRWASARTLLARDAGGAWSLLRPGGGRPIAVAAEGMPAEAVVRTAGGRLAALVGGAVFGFDPATGARVPIATLASEGLMLAPERAGPAAARLILVRGADNAVRMATLDVATGRVGPSIAAVGGTVLDVDAARGRLLHTERGIDGTVLRLADLSGGTSHELLRLNAGLTAINWGGARLIEYRTAAGAPAKAAVLLPPDYRADRRYPTLMWVYPGYEVRGLQGDFLTDPLQPGLYNLRLYAARGYVVVVPSMPLDRARPDVLQQLPAGVLPALDALVAAGITDPDRVAVLGQSFGGYGALGLIGQTDRFRAAVAMAGVSSLSSLYTTFDPTARGYDGIEHEKSDNWAEIGQFGLTAPPWRDAAGYERNSPLSKVDRVTAPLLLIHGDADIRGDAAQAERFFYALYGQGRTAELRRYGGESHGLSQSPANIRDAFARTIAWLDRFLAPRAAAGGTGPAARP